MLTGPNKHTNCQVALEYAKLGLKVFPVVPGEKKSFKTAQNSNNHPWGATDDPKEIVKDWTTWPDANIGIATGTRSGIVVLDIDTLDGHGVDGEASLEALIELHGPLPETVEALTPTSGRHFYFQLPQGVFLKSSAGKLGEGIDVRAEGGSVVVPPSVSLKNEKFYEWVRSPWEHEFEVCPTWIVDLCKAGSTANVPAGDLSLFSDEEPMSAIKLAAQSVIAAPKGTRNVVLFKAALALGKLVASGQLSVDEVYACLNKAAKTAGLDDSEILSTINSGLKAGQNAAVAKAAADPSHDALALQFGKMSFDNDAKYSAIEGKWYLWNSVCWMRDDELRHVTLVREFIRSVSAAMDAVTRRQMRSKATIMSVADLARSNPGSGTSPDKFDADRMLLGTPGGTVELRTGKMREPRREDMITQITSVTPSSDTPVLWLAFLFQIFDGNIELIEFMQRLAGYALTGHVSEHKLFFFHGSGRNGKSVFINVLLKIMGPYARRMPSSAILSSKHEQHPTDIAGLLGKRLVVGSELPRGATWNEARIKEMTGGDRLTARFMRQDFFDFDPVFTLIIVGNNRPSLQGVDEAMRARMVLVPFNVTIAEDKQDKNLEEKLIAQEGPQILQWAIDGAVSWAQNDLAIPHTVRTASSDYLDDEDLFAQFLASETSIAVGKFTPTSAIKARYQEWSEKQGIAPLSTKAIGTELRARGFEQKHTNKARGFIGLDLCKPGTGGGTAS